MHQSVFLFFAIIFVELCNQTHKSKEPSRKSTLGQGVSWCDDLDFKVLTKFCKPNGHSKYL